MMLTALACFARYGRNIPMTEDWLLVPPLTGNEPDLADWLWAQNNEHRIPLPRLIMLILLKVTRGDFRAGMLFNIFSLGVLGLFMIRVSRQLRGGRTSFADAFFPIILLHLGNWDNLFWSWQLSFVVPTVLICLIILVLVRNKLLARRRDAVIGGIGLVLLPLCGAIGLLFVPFLALWFGYIGVRHWHAAKAHAGRQWIGGFLIGSAALALCLTGLYFIGYESPSWTPPRLGPGASLEAAIQFMALGFGPIARSSWMLSIIAAMGFLLFGLFATARGIIQHKGREKHRAMSIMVIFGSFILFSLAMGWGRGAVVSIWGYWPIRYAILAMPALCITFFIWTLYGPTKLRTPLQAGLFLVMGLLIPFNTIHGLHWRNWYVAGMASVERDLMEGTPRSVLAERHRDFLFHSIEPGKLADLMEMLHAAKIGPFARMRVDQVKPKNRISSLTSVHARELVTQEIRYHMPGAGEVFLVWGISGWKPVAEEMRPSGTKIKNKAMHTPMIPENGTFFAKVQLPAGKMLDYGFLITERRGIFDLARPVWDGNRDYRKLVTENGLLEVKSTKTMPNELSSVLDKGRYLLIGVGVLLVTWFSFFVILGFWTNEKRISLRQILIKSHFRKR